MADTLTLTGGNKQTGKFVDFYNQLAGQLREQAAPVTYEQIQAPEQIQAQRIGVEEQTREGLAKEIAAYLRPYTEDAIRSRQQQTAADRAAADVDAYSRGMGSSTWLGDAKARMAFAEASDIASLEKEYQGNLLQQVFAGYQDYLNRKQQADTQNAANQLAADQVNLEALTALAQANADGKLKADMYNSDLAAQLLQLAWGYAGDMYSLSRKGSGTGTNGGITVDTLPLGVSVALTRGTTGQSGNPNGAAILAADPEGVKKDLYSSDPNKAAGALRILQGAKGARR